jgi:hypothetical protein
MAYLQDVSEGSKLGGLGYGSWVFFGFVVILMVTFAVCAVRKLTRVRTKIFINRIFYKK